jgi:SAM-dependent methyltransferase
MTPAAIELYAAALERGPLYLRAEDGTRRRLPLEQWLGPLAPADARVLDRALGPVLDVGCGPGRHVLALAHRGELAVGVDVTPAAVRHARAHGAAVLLGSVFAPVPGAGHWRTALLLDGNIGIGGRPVALIDRLRTLLRSDGSVLCELDPPGSPTRSELIALENARGVRSAWFAWARVSVEGIHALAARARMSVERLWSEDGRWFGQLACLSPNGVEQQLDRQRLSDQQPQRDRQTPRRQDRGRGDAGQRDERQPDALRFRFRQAKRSADDHNREQPQRRCVT